MSFRRGWLDRSQGLGWHADYDRWHAHKQLAYERGRRAAAIAEGEGTVCTAQQSWSVFSKSLNKRARYAALKEVGVK